MTILVARKLQIWGAHAAGVLFSAARRKSRRSPNKLGSASRQTSPASRVRSPNHF